MDEIIYVRLRISENGVSIALAALRGVENSQDSSHRYHFNDMHVQPLDIQSIYNMQLHLGDPWCTSTV